MIQMRCSVVDPRAGAAPVDADITAPAGTTVAQVAPQLLALVGLPADRVLLAAGRPLSPQALLGRAPLLHGVLLTVATGGPPPRPPAVGLLRLAVVGGPDAGRSHPLTPGEHVLGRSPSAHLRFDDAGMSRRHATLTVAPDGVRVRDLGSTNGTEVDGVPVGAEGLTLRPGQRVRTGRSTSLLRPPGAHLAATRPTGTGLVEVNRSPRPSLAAARVEVRRPPSPTAPSPSRPPWLAMLVPLALAGPVAWFAHQPTYLLFGLMSPVMMGAGAVTDRRTRRRQRRDEVATWRAAVVDADARLAAALRDEVTRLRQVSGDPAEVLDVVGLPTSRLWERGLDAPDLLEVAVGTGRVGADVLLRDDEPHEPPHLDDAPVRVGLVRCGHLGVSGPREQVLGLARWLVGQLAAWHSPRVLQVVLVTQGGAADWSWTSWLPHRSAPAGSGGAVLDLEQLVRARTERLGPGPWRGPRVVVVLDGVRALQGIPGLATVLAEGPAVGVHALCLADDRAGLPGECRAVVELSGDGTAAVSVPDATPLAGVRADGVAAGWAERVARALAPLRDATPDPGGLPSSVRLLDLLDHDATDPTATAAAWARRERTTEARVGMGADGVVALDLRRDGPHALVGGTTGSGKSELLQTLVTALAVGNRPDEMSFVLVDYKGGAAFRGCAHLPHTIGLVTDLDEHLAQRALVSLGAELTRRERLLDEAGAKDLEQYQAWRAAGAGRPRLARLVVVIDEFRVLAQELPPFMTGLVRIAAVGRSLGVHVVLATQRPGGVVTADIKANVNLRVALRVRDRVDSEDVLDSPDAADLVAGSPGRALARTGPGPLVSFQVARVGGSDEALSSTGVLVRPVGPGPAVGEPAPAPAVPSGDDDLARIVAATRQAARDLAIPPAAPVWLPPLPDLVVLDTLTPRDDGAVPLGLLDLPDAQRQDPFCWHPRTGTHLAVAGAPRTGRTTLLVTLAVSLAARWSPDDLHLHVVDAASGQLRGLEALPHTGTVLTRDEPRLIARLVDRLAQEVRRRNDLPATQAAPALVLLVDGWDALVQSLDAVDHGRPVDDLLALLRDGEAVGLRAVVAGERGVLLSRLAGVVSRRLLLRPADPTDLLLAGLPSAAEGTRQPPGRALRVPDGAQVQLAVPDRSGDLPEALRAAAEVATARWAHVAADPLRIARLPTCVAARSVETADERGDFALVGVGGDDARPVGLDLGTDPLAVVAGPPGSGRSTALATIARWRHERGAPVLAVCPRPSPLARGDWPALPPDHPGLDRLLAGPPGLCVLVDDADLLLDHPVDELLAALARRPGNASLVVAGTTSTLLATFRGVTAAARVARTGLLLAPTSASDGEVLGVRAQLPDRSPPGRGLLVVRGEQTPVQVAT